MFTVRLMRYMSISSSNDFLSTGGRRLDADKDYIYYPTIVFTRGLYLTATSYKGFTVNLIVGFMISF